MAKAKQPVLFYAYPSNPPDIGEGIEHTCKLLRQGNIVEVHTWRDAEIVGFRVIKQVTKKIDSCNIFCCDLTYLNMNVLFELGYAIAKNKKIFISLNTDTKGYHERFSSIAPLVSIGYQGYKNSHDLHESFYTSGIYKKDKETLQESLSLFENPEQSSILYLNSMAQSNAVFRASEVIMSYPGQNIIDDPEEMPSDTLLWYCRKIAGCEAAIAHFMSSHQIGSEQRNYLVALVAGLIYGYQKPLYILAQTPFETPSDMPDMVKTYATAAQAEGLAKRFVAEIASNRESILKERQDYALVKEKNRNLGKVRLGEYLAENESESLSDYFVETGSFYEVTHGTQSLFLGRKGTGKTACLYAARDYFASDRRNLVITIKPAGYEVDGLIEILSNARTDENQGFLVEALWKYLIYSEICKNIVDYYEDNPGMHQDSSIRNLIDFAKDYNDILLLPFSERLRNSIDSMKLNGAKEDESFREYVGRKLHSGILRLLGKNLLPVINRYKVLAILIDNLDKGWHVNVKVSNVSQVIFGLLSVSRRIADDIKHEARQALNVNIKNDCVSQK